MKTLRFHSMDTWFFKQARSIQPSNEARSVFPPSMQTLSGAVRGLIGDLHEVNWQSYHADQNHPLRNIIGYMGRLAPLSFRGPWLCYQNERLFPVPFCLARRDDELFRLTPGNPVHCDLGLAVRLAAIPAEAAGAKPIENAWITQTGMQTILDGGVPPISSIYHSNDAEFPLYSEESRLGIARNNVSRSNHHGKLYQTSHIRPDAELAIDIQVRGLSVDLPSRSTIRLGGEGRPAVVEQCAASLPELTASIEPDETDFCLFLISPLRYQATTDSPLPGFHRQEHDGLTVWIGTIEGIRLELHSATVGKIVREGGWDLAKKKPKSVENLIPAGSTYFIRLQDPADNRNINRLHGAQLGDQIEFGFGEIAIGRRNKDKI